jgi:hypothetical protein
MLEPCRSDAMPEGQAAKGKRDGRNEDGKRTFFMLSLHGCARTALVVVTANETRDRPARPTHPFGFSVRFNEWGNPPNDPLASIAGRTIPSYDEEEMDIELPLSFLISCSLLAYALSMAITVYYFNRRSPINRWFAVFCRSSSPGEPRASCTCTFR